MRILFITANRLGDSVLSTGLLAWLEARYPSARFTIVCGPMTADLFRAVPRLDRIIPLPKKRWNAHWLGLWILCRDTRWDLIVDLRNSLVSRLLRAKNRAYRPPRATGAHKVVDNAATLRLAPPPSPYLWIDNDAKNRATHLVPKVHTVLALAPAANWPLKQWPAERFAELALRLIAPKGPLAGAPVLIAAAPHERDSLSPLFQALPQDRIINVIGEDLLTIAACLRRCRMFVGNDSGLMHLAAAVNVPTLALFGPGHPQIYGPWGQHGAVVCTPESGAEPLASRGCGCSLSHNLMQSLSVTTVEKAARAHLEKTSVLIQ